MSDVRKFIRHPVGIPVHVLKQSSHKDLQIVISNISEGGVAFQTDEAFEKGSILEVSILHTQPPFQAAAVVCWCRGSVDPFEVGVRFLDEASRFQARMVQQVCHIEDYRRKACSEGRFLSSEAAAIEWIELYAADFGGR